jgi:hypothetical protein
MRTKLAAATALAGGLAAIISFYTGHVGAYA